MKHLALRLAFISLLPLFAAAPLSAAEKKTVFNTEELRYESGTGVERCRDKCGRRSGPDLKSLLAEGWKVASSTPKQVVAEQYWHVPCNTCLPHGCVCIGTEYLLERDEPAPKAPTAGKAIDARVNDSRSGLIPAGNGPSGNELGELRKEIELLKRENASLKRENESLRDQLKSLRK